MPDFNLKPSSLLKGSFRSLLQRLHAVKSAFDGQCWVMFLHNVLRRQIYPTLLRPRTFVHYSFSIISSRPAGLPNCRDHGSLSQNRPRMSISSLMTLQKKHFYTWCAGLIVHALLTIYNVRVKK